MGLLSNLFGKKSEPGDALTTLRQKVEDNPKEGRFAQDLATQLKAKGQVAEAVDYAVRSAQAYRAGGFFQRGVGVLKLAMTWGDPTPELLEELVQLHLELKHKEDAREVLQKLRQLHREAGRHADGEKVAARIAELGPGR
jgi:hypothetical protein